MSKKSTDWLGLQREETQKAHKAQISSLELELKHTKDTLERVKKIQPVRVPVPREAEGRHEGDTIRVCIPDTHGAKVDKLALAALLADLKAIDPHEIILLGDHVDCGGFLAQHLVMGYVAETSYSYEDDLAHANAFLDAVQAAAPRAKIEYIEGNHECLTADHDVLTQRGWVAIPDITISDDVATLGAAGQTEWQRPSEVIKRAHSGEIVTSDISSFYSTRMTPGHRVCFYGQYMGDIRYRTAGEMAKQRGSSIDIPTTGIGRSNDYAEISDNELRLLGWVLTDGSINAAIRIYQSKPDGIAEIKALLSDMGVDHTFRFRNQRTIRPIGGITVQTSLPQGIFYITTKGRAQALKALGLEHWDHKDRIEKQIPAYIHRLSQRQFHVFLEAVIAGDGHRTSENSASIYGNKPFLEALQALCVMNGVRALLRSKTRQGVHSHWVLYTVKSRAVRVNIKDIRTEKMDCDVFCLSLANANFFVRRNGAVHITGNCRVEAWAVTQTLRHSRDAEGLRQLYSPEFRLSLKAREINYYRRSVFYDGLPVPGVIKRGKCFFLHGVSTSRNAVGATLAKMGGNVVFGHTHRHQSELVRLVGAGVIGGWNPGCLCELQPLWQHTAPTDWTHGYGVQLISPTGEFLHLNVPIIGGKSNFASLFKL